MNLVLAGLSFLAIFGLAEALYRFTKVPTEWMRKLQHVLSGLLAACFPWIFSSPFEVVLLGAAMAPLLWIFRKKKLLSSMHDVKRASLGEFYFLLSIAGLFFLSFGKAPIFYLIPVLLLTLSDSLAAIVGSRWQKGMYAIRGHVKSIAGSAAFFASGFAIVFLTMLIASGDPLRPALIALEVSLCLTLIEAASRKGIDNFLIPLVSYFLLLHLVKTSLFLIQFELAAVFLFALLLWILSRRVTIRLDLNRSDAIGMEARRGGMQTAFLTLQIKGDLGYIGHYGAQDQKSGKTLLRAAAGKLKQLGAKQAIGPIDGSTWNRYRLAMEDKNPFFLGEPKNPPSYCNHFTAAGFSIMETYESRIATDLLKRRDAFLKLERRMEKLGFSVEPLKLEEFEKTLEKIYEMSLAAFAENPFYEPISKEEFCIRYGTLKPLLQPEFVQLAYDRDQKLAGYALAYEDPANPSHLIFKTLAADRKVRASGLGVFLFDKIHHLAHQKGKRAVIHALMHEKNNSLKLSKSMQTDLFRTYALYRCTL